MRRSEWEKGDTAEVGGASGMDLLEVACRASVGEVNAGSSRDEGRTEGGGRRYEWPGKEMMRRGEEREGRTGLTSWAELTRSQDGIVLSCVSADRWS